MHLGYVAMMIFSPVDCLPYPILLLKHVCMPMEISMFVHACTRSTELYFILYTLVSSLLLGSASYGHKNLACRLIKSVDF